MTEILILKVIKILQFFFDKRRYDARNMSRGKMSDFVSLPLFGFTLVIKLRNLDIEGHGNTLIFLIKKLCQI